MIRVFAIAAALLLPASLAPDVSAQSASRPCGDRAPEHSAAWIRFMAAVENNYGSLEDMSLTERNMVLGHALSRYEPVAGPYDMDCIAGKLAMDDMNAMMEGYPTNFAKIRKGAANGQFDAQVKSLTGESRRSTFSEQDMRRRDDGPVYNQQLDGWSGQFGLSDGSRVRLEDGSTVAIDGSDTAGGNDWFNDEFWGDLPNTPGGGAPDPGSPALTSQGGIGNVMNWRFEGDYRSCYERYRKTYEQDASWEQGGLAEGAYAVLVRRKDGRYECYSGNTVGRSPSIQSDEINKSMRKCENRLDEDVSDCSIWYR